MGFSHFLFYLLVLFLPVQLGYHWFFSFSYVSGVRSDYLAPTLYVTDILGILYLCSFLPDVYASFFYNLRSKKRSISLASSIFIFSFLYLLFHSIYVTDNPWPSLYRLSKYILWYGVGYCAVQSNVARRYIIMVLSIGAVATSFLGLVQWMNQSSIGGWMWVAGERTFSVSSPGIATMAIGGERLLRAYSLFPHPNVFGAYLSLVMICVLFEIRRLYLKKSLYSWYVVCLYTCIVGIVLTGSRTVWLVTAILLLCSKHTGVMLWRMCKEHRYLTLLILYVFLITTATLPFFWPHIDTSMSERTRLSTYAWEEWKTYPLYGVGLNRSLSSFFPFQPVHHGGMLILVEGGLVGVLIFGYGLYRMYVKALSSSHQSWGLVLWFLGLSVFDHYFFTLQQGMMMGMIVCVLVFLPQNTYTGRR